MDEVRTWQLSSSVAECVANDFAARPERAGRNRTLRFKVGGDGSSVIVLVRHENGTFMRMNFSRAGAAVLWMELQAAATLARYDPHSIMPGGHAGGHAGGPAA